MNRLTAKIVTVSLIIAASLLPAGALVASNSIDDRDPQGLELASVHAAIGPLTGRQEDVWYSKRADHAVPVASLTKLMTAMVVLEAEQPLDEWLTIVERTEEVEKNAYSRMRIGSELTRGTLLRLTLMSSENLASHVLASHYPGGRTAFIEAMNAKAESLGMTATRFVDPSGLSTQNRSTATDMLTMVRAAFQHDHLRYFSTTAHHTARFRSPVYTLGYGNTNSLVSHGQWDVQLSKTGYLKEAGRCLAMVADIDGQPVAMVFLNSRGTRTPLGDAGRTRRWLATGEGGPVAPAAREYEQEQAASLDGEG